jgi:SPX domain protein involved in polyphosphate accumulation
MASMNDRMRHELKFYLPVAMIDQIRPLIANHVQHDPYCADQPDKTYTVRSIYFDTDDLHFYHEKLDSVKTRRKLRVRTYNTHTTDSIAFVEIKRKFGRVGFKDRLMLPLDKVDHAMNGVQPEKVLGDEGSFSQRTILGKIRYLLNMKRLHPVVLVTYDREAFMGLRDSNLRVTFDRNIRSLLNPTMEQIFDEESLVQFEEDQFVLELKFGEAMPGWMANLIRKLNLSSESYSKYCTGIDACLKNPENQAGAAKALETEG